MIKNLIIIFSMLIQSIVYGQEFSKTQQPYIPVNYIKNAGVESGITGYALYNDGDVAVPVDGVSGTPTITMTSSTTNPLAGSRSLVISKPSGVSHRGQGFATEPFTIENKAKGKVIRTLVDYEVVSGTYATGDMAIWVYDITNARMIQPSSYLIENSGLKETKFVEWQSSIDSNSYRLIYHITSTSTAAYSLRFDSFEAGLGPKVYGSIATDWVSFTPTGNWTNNTTYTGKWRRVGDVAEIEYKLELSGAPNTIGLQVYLPTGLSADLSKYVSTGLNIGRASVFDTGTMTYTASAFLAGTNTISIIVSGASGTYVNEPLNVNSTVPFTLGSGDTVTISAQVKILGWSSSQQLSQDADTRVIAFRAIGSGQSIPAGATTVFINPTVSYDDVGGYNSSTGFYTCKVAGVYRVSGGIRRGSGPSNQGSEISLGVYKNGSLEVQLGAYVSPVTATIYMGTSGSSSIKCNAGDVISLRVLADSGAGTVNASPAYSYFSMERISGPSQIAASETVVAVYSQSSGQSIPNAATTTINYDTKEIDTHNAVTTGANWKFTAPVSGIYYVSGFVGLTGNTNGTREYTSYASGVARCTDAHPSSSVANSITVGCSYAVRLLQGETIFSGTYQNTGSSLPLVTIPERNKITITRIGNY